LRLPHCRRGDRQTAALVVGLLALWRRDWHFLGGFTVVTGVALAVSIGLYGLDSNLDYLRVLIFLSHHGEYHHLNQSINAILNRLLYHGPSVDQDPHNPIPNSGFPPHIPAVYLATILSSLVMTAIPFVVRTANFNMPKLLSFCAAIVLVTMASPIAWVHHYNVLLPGFWVALRVALDRLQGKQLWLVLVAVLTSFVLTAFPLMPPFDPTIPDFNLFQSHVFIGACILVWVLLFEMSLHPQDQTPRSDLPVMTPIPGEATQTRSLLSEAAGSSGAQPNTAPVRFLSYPCVRDGGLKTCRLDDGLKWIGIASARPNSPCLCCTVVAGARQNLSRSNPPTDISDGPICAAFGF
jgi:hypothetical protein